LRTLLNILRQQLNKFPFKLIANKNKDQNSIILSFICYIREPEIKERCLI